MKVLIEEWDYYDGDEDYYYINKDGDKENGYYEGEIECLIYGWIEGEIAIKDE